MIENEITVKGIILAVNSQGEYGKRVSLLSDKLGKITVFAQGAAKQKSKIIGVCRPFVCGEFTLAGGKNAFNLHGVNVMESFEEMPLDPETVFTGTYILEFASYFTGEGMAEQDARNTLNLIYMTLKALKEIASRRSALTSELIRRIFELRMMVNEGIYTETPFENEGDCSIAWEYALRSPLLSLYDERGWKLVFRTDGTLNETGESFLYSVKHLKNSQIDHKFKSEELLQG